MDKADDMLARYEELGKSPIPDFDVYWEVELLSEVRVGKTEVEVVRHVFHPVKQLFYADRISRYIFGEIIKNKIIQIISE